MSYAKGPGPHHPPAPPAPYGGVPGRLSGARQAASIVWALAPLYTLGILSFAVIAVAAVRLRSWFQTVAALTYLALAIIGFAAAEQQTDTSDLIFAIAWLCNMIGALVHALLIRESVFHRRPPRASHRRTAPGMPPPMPPPHPAPYPAHAGAHAGAHARATPPPMTPPTGFPTPSNPPARPRSAWETPTDPRSPGLHSPNPHSPGLHSPGPHSPGPHSPGPHSPGPHSPGPRDWTTAPGRGGWRPAGPTGPTGPSAYAPQRPHGRLGQYVLLDKIGEGGQGTVYLARHPDGSRVALKVLHHRISERERESFIREVTAAQRVPSYSTARVIDAGVMDGTAFIVSEYVSGASLERQVRESGPMSGDSLIRLAIATSGALAAIHRAGIVHRDFKPANVLLAPDGPRVIDFGLAKTMDQGSTTAGVKGTPLYMSPEQINGESIGPSSDMFSWASTMIYGGTGRIAFNGSNPYQVLHQIMTKEPDLSGLPGPLVRPIAACLNKDPRARPRAADLIAAITG